MCRCSVCVCAGVRALHAERGPGAARAGHRAHAQRGHQGGKDCGRYRLPLLGAREPGGAASETCFLYVGPNKSICKHINQAYFNIRVYFN